MSSIRVRVPVRTLVIVIMLQLLDSSSCEGTKRVPQGFVGMRGKKYYDYDDTGTYDKRRSQGFVGVKGKKDLLNTMFSPYDAYHNSPYNFYKRAPMGFVGMRGKKDVYDPIDYSQISAEYVPKRGSILGQIDYSSDEDEGLENDKFNFLNELIQRYVMENHINDKQSNGETETTVKDGLKTPPSNDESNSVEASGSSELTKRAAQMNQFFGMRGKKSTENASYRGSKRPFDMSFRGKFVGVRGKKSVNMQGQMIKMIGSDAAAGWNKRKGPGSGFFGMRGKKWIDPDFLSEEAPTN